MKILLTTLNAKYIHSSLALRYLAAYCRTAGLDVAVREYTVNNSQLEILGDIYACQAEVIGLACYIWNFSATLELARLIKKVQPEAVIVLGGPEVSYEPETVLNNNSAIDYIVLGEGEQTLAAVLKVLSGGLSVDDLAGLVYRSHGETVAAEPQVVDSLDSIPFPYTSEDMALLKDKIFYYESSRGCPFSCQYCLSSATSGVRFLSQQRVLSDLKFFIDHDVRQVKFVDRTFNARKDHYFPILKFLAAQDCRTNFHFEIAADIWDEEVVDFLRQVPYGRFQFEIGVQSTHEPTLESIKRRNNWPRIVRSVSRVRDYGNIHLHLDLIIGLPNENQEQFAKSFNDVYSLQPDMLQIGFLKLLKGSGIRRDAAEHGYVYMDDAPYEVLANNYLDYSQIRRLKIFEEVFEQIYNSGRFKYSLPWLIELSGSNAFIFYYNLSRYWEEQGLHLVAHSAKSLYKYMADYCAATYPDALSTYLEFLKFDALMSEQGAVRPDFLPWNQTNQATSDRWAEQKTNFWRNSLVVRQYIPDYVFTTWRDIKKNYHIEVFAASIPAYLTSREVINNTAIAVLFSYSQSKPVFQVIAAEHFDSKG